MRRVILLALVVVALIAVTAATAAVRKMSITSPVTAGNYARLVVSVSPRAQCLITVKYGGVISRSAALRKKSGGRIAWRWLVPATTPAGRVPVRVVCGKAGTLRTSLLVKAAVPPMSLADAALAVCDQAPTRVMAKYKTAIKAVPPSATLDALRRKYGPLDCAYSFPNPVAEAGAYYLLSTAAGPTPCTFRVTAKVIWINAGPPGPGYTVPVNETYGETCSSLR